MRRLITLHIGRGLERLEAYPTSMFKDALWAFLFGLLGSYMVRIPGTGPTDLQRWGLHPEDAKSRVIRLLSAAETQGRQAVLATNDASTINALVEALREGELRVVSHAADGTVRQWDVDQMMAFWQAREQGSEMTPAAMLIKLGVWP